MLFKIGDFISPVLMGAITAAAVAAVVSPGSSVPWAMLAGMLLGAASQLIAVLLLMPLFGAFEVMVPAMLSGMSSGILAGMLVASGMAGGKAVIGVGAIVGTAVFCFVWWKNKTLQGKVL